MFHGSLSLKKCIQDKIPSDGLMELKKYLNIPWTQMDDLETYEKWVESALLCKGGGQSIARWELCFWNNHE